MNSRFAIAVHILTFLRTQAGEPATSELIASSVNTNPSFIRRLLGQLAEAGLTRSQLGTGGGALLARPGEAISLLDVYRAVEPGDLFGMHREPPNPKCPVGRNIQGVLTARLDVATQALEAELGQVTIADLAHDVRRRERRAGTGTSPR
jgi:Rrf2 family protein